jgi:hypothetical protein
LKQIDAGQRDFHVGAALVHPEAAALDGELEGGAMAGVALSWKRNGSLIFSNAKLNVPAMHRQPECESDLQRKRKLHSSDRPAEVVLDERLQPL